MVTKTFHRTKYWAYVKLGSRQKSMRRYKRPTGRHNKSRQKWRSRPPMVEIGYKNKCQTAGMINEKTPVMVNNLNELRKLNAKQNIAIFAKIGKKNKMQMAKEAQAKNIEIYNLNTTKFLKECARDEKIRMKTKSTKVESKQEKKAEHKHDGGQTK
ncbi:MAG: eL32 family ribosomal protein [Nanoarchaeota archaeon]